MHGYEELMRKLTQKLGPVMDRLSVLERNQQQYSSLSDNGGSTGQSSAAGVAPAVFALLLTWKSRGGADFETETHMD